MKKVLYTGFCILCVLGIAIAVFGQEQFRIFTVLTGSMEPELPVGSVVFTTPAGINEIQPGDDISYVLNENLTVVTHRVVEVDKETSTVITQGLTNSGPDKPVRIENVIGKVRLCIPYIGYLFRHLSTAAGKIIMLIVLAAAWGLVLIIEKWKSDPEGKEAGG